MMLIACFMSIKPHLRMTQHMPTPRGESTVDGDNTTARAQHNEQMIGLWHPQQQAMLGMEFYTKYMVPKVLYLVKSELLLFYLPHLYFDIGRNSQGAQVPMLNQNVGSVEYQLHLCNTECKIVVYPRLLHLVKAQLPGGYHT